MTRKFVVVELWRSHGISDQGLLHGNLSWRTAMHGTHSFRGRYLLDFLELVPKASTLVAYHALYGCGCMHIHVTRRSTAQLTIMSRRNSVRSMHVRCGMFANDAPSEHTESLMRSTMHIRSRENNSTSRPACGVDAQHSALGRSSQTNQTSRQRKSSSNLKHKNIG